MKRTKDPIDAVLFPDWPAEAMDGVAGEMQALPATARRIAGEFRDLAATLAVGDDLTEKGVLRRLEEFAVQETARLDGNVARPLARARADRGKLRDRLAGASTDVNVALAVEIRQALRAMPDAVRWATVHAAANDGETAVVAAVLSAPRFMQRDFLPGDMLSRLRETWSQNRDPQTARAIRVLDDAISAAEQTLLALRSQMIATPGLSAFVREALRQRLNTDPLARLIKAA